MRTIAICLILATANIHAGENNRFSIPKLKSIKEIRLGNMQRQTLDYSCGAASLSILLKEYFRDEKSEQDLLAEIIFRLSPEEMTERAAQGFSMLDLKRTAERLGYSAAGAILSIESATKLQGPVVILLRRKEINHFVVLKGIANGKAFLADPTRGHIKIPVYALGEEWHGETLILGRENFGLPTNHGLAISRKPLTPPEIDTARALMQKQLLN